MRPALFAAILAVSTPALSETFGTFQAKDLKAQNIEAAVGGYKDGSDAPIHVVGTVKQVCEKEGCWMVLEEKEQNLRVMFKNHSFFVGKALIGKKVVAEGVLFKKVQTVAQQKHFLEDAGATRGEIEKITKPKESFQLVATAVKTL